MKSKKMMVIIVLTALIMMSTMTFATDTITIGSTAATSSHFPYAVAMTKAIREALPQTTVTLIETGASVDNIKRLVRKEIQIGMTTSDVAIQAAKARGKFEGSGAVNLEVLFVCDFAVLYFAVREDAGLKKLSDLEGKRFSPGMHGSGAELLTRRAFSMFNINPDWIPGTLTEAVEGIKNRRLVGYSKYGPGRVLDATLREIMVSTPMDLLGLNQEQEKLLMEKVSGIEIYTIPENIIPNQEAIRSPGIAVTYSTLAGTLDDNTGFLVAKALNEKHNVIAEAIPRVKDYDYAELTLAMIKSGLKIHPGAKRYWESVAKIKK